MEKLSPQEIIDSFKKALGSGLVDGKSYEREVAVKTNRFRCIWLYVKREALREAVQHLSKIQEYPHLVII